MCMGSVSGLQVILTFYLTCQLKQEDQLFLIERFKAALGDENETITGMKVDLIGQVHHQKAKEILMELIRNDSVGVKVRKLKLV